MSALTPAEVLDFWFADAANDAEAAKKRNTLWFQKSDETDALIRERFGALPPMLERGAAADWVAQGARQRLAAIIALDQFPRNIHRNTADAFRYDPIALGLCKEGLDLGQDLGLTPIERHFFYLPLEHSEAAADQVDCVARYSALLASSPDAWREMAQDGLDYAHRHKAVIDRFGRYPHRNAALGRKSTAEEITFLKTPGSRF